jgi:hypothetical protein
VRLQQPQQHLRRQHHHRVSPQPPHASAPMAPSEPRGAEDTMTESPPKDSREPGNNKPQNYILPRQAERVAGNKKHPHLHRLSQLLALTAPKSFVTRSFVSNIRAHFPNNKRTSVLNTADTTPVPLGCRVPPTDHQPPDLAVLYSCAQLSTQ